jgi:predicted aspartyl protease
MVLIQGYLDDYRQPRVAITIQGARGDVTLDAVIDTGFDGHLCLPVAVKAKMR